jgi:hypothetical protein
MCKKHWFQFLFISVVGTLQHSALLHTNQRHASFLKLPAGAKSFGYHRLVFLGWLNFAAEGKGKHIVF